MSSVTQRDTYHARGNLRGKHTKAPGYQPGNHWVVCDSCGFDIRAFDIKETWDGRLVCPADWEPRHPQDFVRSKEDRIAAEQPIRTEPEPIFIGDDCNNSAVAGIGICGIMICGIGCGKVPEGFIPTVPTNTL